MPGVNHERSPKITSTAAKATYLGYDADEVPPPRPRQGLVVLLVDPRPLSRDSIATHIPACAPDLDVLACAQPQDIDCRPDLAAVNIVILNLGATRLDAPTAPPSIQALQSRLPGVPLAVLTDHTEANLVVEGLRLGLRGYIPSDVDVDVMVGALHLIGAGGTFIPAAVLLDAPMPAPEEQSPATAIAGLTPRQTEVLTRLRLGKTNKIIAYELNMCESTVKVHVRHIMRKLGASNRTQAVYLAKMRFSGEP